MAFIRTGSDEVMAGTGKSQNYATSQGRKSTALVVNCYTEKFDLAAPNHSYLNSRRFS